MQQLSRSHEKNLLIGAVSLIRRFKLKDGGVVLLKVRNDIERQLAAHDFLKAAPFRTVHLILRWGTRDAFTPNEYLVDKGHDELQVSIELDAAKLKAHESDPRQLAQLLHEAVVKVLQDIAANYDLPFEFLDAMLLSGALASDASQETPSSG